jgi:hypothetical protein
MLSISLMLNKPQGRWLINGIIKIEDMKFVLCSFNKIRNKGPATLATNPFVKCIFHWYIYGND